MPAAHQTPLIAPGEEIIMIPTAVETPDGLQQVQVPLHVLEHFAKTHGTVPLQVPPHVQQQQPFVPHPHNAGVMPPNGGGGSPRDWLRPPQEQLCPCAQHYLRHPDADIWRRFGGPPAGCGGTHHLPDCPAMWVNDDLLDYETAYGDGDYDDDLDEPEAFPDNSPQAFMTGIVAYQADVDEPGLAVLDTGCSRTMNGSHWAESFSAALAERGLQGVARQVNCSVLGVGGTIQATVDMRWPVGIFENDGAINALQVEGSCPFLFSREAMSALDFAVRPKTKTLDSLQLGVFGEALCITGTGHLAISLLRFSQAWPAKAYGTEHHAQIIAPPEDGPSAETWVAEYSHDHVPAITYREEPNNCDGQVYDDHIDYLEIYLADTDSIRKFSHKKSKKIEAMHRVLREDDIRQARAVRGEVHRTDPPIGNVMLKQVFGGEAGLTLKASLERGWQVGVPLDQQDGWDALQRTGRRQLQADLEAEDPYLTTFSHPCGPWGAWSRFNLARGGAAAATVLSAREATRPLVKLVNDTVLGRVQRGRHALAEHPAASECWSQPECKDIQKLFNSNELYFCRADGCMLGYHDAESGLPNLKPMGFITDMVAAVGIFSQYRCTGDHEHQTLEGSNKFGRRTLQAAVWPTELDYLILSIIDQQILIDEAEIAESFATRRKADDISAPDKRTSRLRRRIQHALPPYVHAPGPPPQPGPDGNYHHDDPIPDTESERRDQWNLVPKSVRDELEKLHANLGHPSTAGMMRLLRRAGALKDVVRAAGLLSCTVCLNFQKIKAARVSRLQEVYEFNVRVLLDTIFIHDVTGSIFVALNIVCDGTTFQVVVPLGAGQGVPGSDLVRRAFMLAWVSWAGMPKQVFTDRGKEFSPFGDWLQSMGVEFSTSSTEAPWQHGRCERRGAVWKQVFNRVVEDHQITGRSQVENIVPIVTSVVNSMVRHNGYHPDQWVLGARGPRVPASLLSDESREALEVQSAAEDPESAIAQIAARRESARIAFVRADNDSRVRRALLHRAVPHRGPFPQGAGVYFRRSQITHGDSPVHRWFGVARVLGHEGRGHGVWLRYGTSIILCSPEQLRFAAADEILASSQMAPYIEQGHAGRHYIDIRRDAVPDDEVPEPDVDQDSAAPAPPHPEDGTGAPSGAVVPDAPMPPPQPVAASAEQDAPPDPVPAELPVDVPLPAEGEVPAETSAPTAAAEDTDPEAESRTPTGPATALTPLAQAMRRDPELLDSGSRPYGPQRTAPTRARSSADPFGPSATANFVVAEALLTGNARADKEVTLSELNEEDKEKFDAAMQKEWNSWLKFDSVEFIEPKVVPPDAQTVGTRWVFTDKNRPRRLAGETVEVQAKARLVVQGHQERYEVRSDSPTASLLGFMLVCTLAALFRWTLQAWDATAAYLQSDGIQRLLILRPPRPLPPGYPEGMLLRAKGTIYGTRDAGRGWWLKLRRIVLENGWIESKLELAMFLFFEIIDTTKRVCRGIMIAHVDDLLVCGTGAKYRASMDAISKVVDLNVKETDFVYCGKRVRQHEDGRVTVGQRDACLAIEHVEIDAARRKNPASPLNPEEITELRSCIGSLGWLARQTRPDLCYVVSCLAQSIGSPTVATLVLARQAVTRAKDHADFELVFYPGNLDIDSCHVFAVTDASLANVDDRDLGPKTRSQGAYVIGLCGDHTVDGKGKADIAILEYHSGAIKRVCRSSLAAETNAALDGIEAAIYVRSVLEEILSAGLHDAPWHKVLLFTDAKSLYDVLSRDIGQAADKRLRIIIAQIRELTMADDVFVHWIDTLVMLADSLTKLEAETGYLLDAITQGIWSGVSTPESLERKAIIRAQRKARAVAKRSG